MNGCSSQIRIFEVGFCWQPLKIAFEDSVTKSKAGYVSGVQLILYAGHIHVQVVTLLSKEKVYWVAFGVGNLCIEVGIRSYLPLIKSKILTCQGEAFVYARWGGLATCALPCY
jgi:hypothetical protein